MSGHSHAKTVKRVKDANDAKRGKIFSKLARVISVAAREGGDPETNSKLKQALEEAKRFNLPKDNVERAIRRGTGEEAGEKLEEVLYEGFGPGGVGIIMEGITDNKNRTLSEVKQILQKHQGKLADEGSVKYQFEQKGIILVSAKSKIQMSNQIPARLASQREADRQNPNVKKEKEELELKVIEAGAEDTRWFKEDDPASAPEGAMAGKDEFLEVQTKIENLEKVKRNLEKQNIEIESSTLGWQAKQEIDVSEKDRAALEKLFDSLDDNEAIQEIYSNLRV